jgi:outer membrane usher protein
VFNEKGVSMGVVGQAGQILARGINDAGELVVRWKDDRGTNQSCSFDYRLKPQSRKKQALTRYEQISATCAKPADVAAASASRSDADAL